MKYHCGLFGRPTQILSDNGTQYTGNAFQNFIKSWGITHLMSSPKYSQSNGFAKRYVKHAKPIIKKVVQSKQDLGKVLLILCTTSISPSLPSPDEMLFGHPVVTLLPRRLEPGPEHHSSILEERKEKMVQHHDATAKKSDLPSLNVGQPVRILDKQSKTWCPGTVQSTGDDTWCYKVETPNGSRFCRNRSMLREMIPSLKLSSVPETPGSGPPS